MGLLIKGVQNGDKRFTFDGNVSAYVHGTMATVISVDTQFQ